MRKTLMAVITALLLLPLFSPDAIALRDFGIEPEKKLARTFEDTADVMFECGDEAKGKGLYTSARSFFNHALQYDPDHRDTRKTMGFKKKRGTWVLEEDMVPLTDKIAESKRNELEHKLMVDTAEIRKEGADELWEFVVDLDLAIEQRMLALYHVLRICPEHRGAQKAVRSRPDYFWYKHWLDDNSDTNRAKWISGAPSGEAITEPTPYEEAAKIDMTKRRSDWFVVHVHIGELSEEWCTNLTKFAEASRKHIFEIAALPELKVPEDDQNRIHYTVFSTRDHFARFVETCSGIDDPSRRKEVSKASFGTPTYNPSGSVWLYPGTATDYGLRDGIAHDVASKEIFRCCGGGAYWLARGLGYLNSTHMNGSTSAVFFGVKASGVIDTGGKEALPGLGTCSSGWRLHVGMELTGGSEMNMTKLAKVRINDFTDEEMAWAFCFADYLTSQHHEKFGQFLKATYDERIKRYNEKQTPETPEEVIVRLLGTLEMGEEGFMEAFKTWALTNYFELPAGEDE